MRIFNELEVDELVVLDINASRYKKAPNLKLITEIANECFMPLGYGGGINSLDDAKKLFEIGCEKIILNTAVVERPELIAQLSDFFGSEAIVVSIDFKSSWLGKNTVWTRSGSFNTKLDPVIWATEVEKLELGKFLSLRLIKRGLGWVWIKN